MNPESGENAASTNQVRITNHAPRAFSFTYEVCASRRTLCPGVVLSSNMQRPWFIGCDDRGNRRGPEDQCLLCRPRRLSLLWRPTGSRRSSGDGCVPGGTPVFIAPVLEIPGRRVPLLFVNAAVALSPLERAGQSRLNPSYPAKSVGKSAGETYLSNAPSPARRRPTGNGRPRNEPRACCQSMGQALCC